MVRRLVTLAVGSLLVLGCASAALARPIPGHPRVNEVDQRLSNQQRRIAAGTAQGQIGGRQAARDSARDSRVANQLSRDEAMHGGHITASEDRQLNRELNRNSTDIYNQRH